MTKEQVAGLIFLVVGLYGLYVSSGLPWGQWNQPGPGVFPLVISSLLCLAGILWLLQRGRTSGAEQRTWHFSKLSTPLKIICVTAVFILVLERLGYLLTSFLYLFVLFFGVSRYRFSKAISLALLFGAVSWVFFEKLLATPLPKGSIWP